jgi:hypothetical protein
MIVFQDGLRMYLQRDLNWRETLQKVNRVGRSNSQPKGNSMVNNSNTMKESIAAADQQSTATQPAKGKWAKTAVVAAIGITLATLTGCFAGKYTGGGFIDSVAGGGKTATFGFSLEALDRDKDGQADQIIEPVIDPETGEPAYYVVWWTGKGEFSYNDHGAGVSFHVDINEQLALDANGEVTDWVGWTGDLRDGAFDDGVLDENDIILTGMQFAGTYVSGAGSGQVIVTLTAKSDSLGSTADTIEINLVGGPYDGYHNSGVVKGGNIQWHPAKAN